MFRYVLINEDGYIIGESFLKGEVMEPLMIRVDEDFALDNKRFLNGKWIDMSQQSTSLENENNSVSVFEVLKESISNSKVDTVTNLKKLDIFLDTEKITAEQYQELISLL